MRWFKHDSSAHRDAKLKKVKRKYGITGYGLYWYCLELIAGNVDRKNITFELEDDAEEISEEWCLDQLKVQEMMRYMVDLKLFEENNGRITCLKIAHRLDDTTSRNPEIRKLLNLSQIKTASENPEETSDRLDKTRLDETRLDQTRSAQTNPLRGEINNSEDFKSADIAADTIEGWSS